MNDTDSKSLLVMVADGTVSSWGAPQKNPVHVAPHLS